MFKLIVIQSILTLCLSSSSPNGWPGNGNWPDGGGGWPDGGGGWPDGGGGDYWPGNGDSSQLKCGTNIPGVINITSDGSRNCSEGEIPWQVSVQKKSNGIWKHACGGVVINKQFVLTSAKCVDGTTFNSGIIRAETGIVDAPKGGFVRRKRMSYPGQDTPGLKYVQRVYVHPDYDEETGKNNIALIHLAVPFGIAKANGTINSICLEKEPNLNKIDQLLISGWGSLNENDQIEPKLQVIQADLIPSNNTDVLLVAQRLNDPADRCQGDAGGPLFAVQNNTAILIGVHSSGKTCSSDEPSIFTKIDQHIDWINKQAVDNGYGN